MTLTLEIISTTTGMPSHRQRSFREDGGRIGRDKGNDWVLPHNKVSSRHAVITFRNGTFYIEDRSRNGVFLNSTTNRLTPGRPQALQSGDVLFIEPYEIQVSLTEDVSESALDFERDADPFAQRPAQPVPIYAQPAPHQDPIAEAEEFDAGSGEVDPMKLLGGSGGQPNAQRSAPPKEILRAEELERRPMAGHYQPPPIIAPPTPPTSEPPPPRQEPGPEEIPEDYDPLLDAIVRDPMPEVRQEPPPPVPFIDPFAPPPPPPPMPPARAERVVPPPVRKPEPVESPAPASDPFDLPLEESGPPDLDPSERPTPPPKAVPRPTPGRSPVAPPAVRPAPPPPAPRPSFEPVPVAERDAQPTGRPAQPASRPPVSPLEVSSPLPPAVPAPVMPPAASPPPPAPPPAAVQGQGVDLAAVLTGAGLEDMHVTPELAESFGRILRVVVTGVMDLLRARQQVKDELRMRQTMFRPLDNNPLKFSANIEDALHNLLVKRNPAYLKPVDAFSDAFDDLRDHQLAMLAGLRVAFEAMLSEFDPARLEEQFDRQLKKGALLSVPAKLRYWDAYRERTKQLLQDMDATFRKWFGEEFVKAYEAQLERLETERREQRP